MLIRRANPKDVTAIKTIEAASGLSPWSEMDYRAETRRRDSFFYVAEDDGTIVAFLLARLITNPNNPQISQAFEVGNAEIYNIAVLPSFRRAHIATDLLHALLRDADLTQNSTLHLEVRTQNNSALRFYQTFGFRIIATRRNFYTNPQDDAFVMRYHVLPTAEDTT